MTFDPSAPGLRNGRFGGLPTEPESAEVLLVPVPWDVTASSGEGARNGPRAILDASPQLEFRNPVDGSEWTSLAMLPFPEELHTAGRLLRQRAADVIGWLERGAPAADAPRMASLREAVNAGCAEMTAGVASRCASWIARDRIVGVVGGDHSTALGLYRALAAAKGPLGLLHLDAHRDLRRAYEGFAYSHASIMRNACDEGLVAKLVQVGVRDFCTEEQDYADASGGRILSFDARSLDRRAAQGVPWDATVREILAELPEEVVVSFDIDALEPWLCPHTGTPVPGGLGFGACLYLLEALVGSGRRIPAFDVTEVVPGRDGGGLDAVVGAQLVYRLACLAAQSRRGRSAATSTSHHPPGDSRCSPSS